MRRLFLNEMDNMRELGGYPTEDGKVIKNNCLVRSNLPKILSDKAINDLIDKNITTIIDLRNDEEVKKCSGIFANNKLFNYHHIKIKGDGKLPDSPETVFDSYIEMIEGKEEIGKIFSIISNSKGGVLYYCNAGKDRTGIVSALILKLLGVSNKDIVVDYIASGIYLKEMLDNFADSLKVNNIKSIITPKPENMFLILEYIEKNYNTVENYLHICGAKSEDLENIKSKYLENI